MHSIRSDVEPVDPSLVPLYITETDIAQYTQMAILTLLVYDTCTFCFFVVTTMDKEIKYFWFPLASCFNKWFQNRYIGILGAISFILTLNFNYRCLGFFWIESLANILLIRVLALYHHSFLLALLIYGSIYDEIVVMQLAESVMVCGTIENPPKVWGALSWAAPMLYEIILMVLALYKAAEHWRETAGFSQFTLVKVLIQDQAIYFIIRIRADHSDRVILCSVMQIISFQLFIPNVLLANLLNVLGSPSLLCVLGSHLLVHLKEAGERGANGGTSYRIRTMSNIEFS
ncbi:hypothetical protein DFH11DRAFT_1547994 [Phellopilus nigrolimitatus]|nr:hypothetical protein DFH11DRAFT_1547994 [Phellopilus nigrolimitatus]